MIATFNHLNIFPSELERDCVELIDYELTSFFTKKSKLAYDYSTIVSQNSKSYSKINFEKMVLNCDELKFLLKDIFYNLNNSINECSVIYEEDMNYIFDERLICLNNLNNTVIQNKITHSITFCCEKVINEAIFKSINLFHSGLVTNYFLNKVNFGILIFGKNNSKFLIEKNRKEIYKKIQGLLINIKIDIRNLMIKNVLNQMKKHLDQAIIA